MDSALEKFYESVNTEQELYLATASDGRVTMRIVSPVLYESSVLIFTSPSSLKYKQLKENPNCCFKVGIFFAEAKAEFPGHTMLEANAELREVYSNKFNGAFDKAADNNGTEAEFILLKPRLIKGWIVDENYQGFPFEYECD